MIKTKIKKLSSKNSETVSENEALMLKQEEEVQKEQYDEIADLDDLEILPW